MTIPTLSTIGILLAGLALVSSQLVVLYKENRQRHAMQRALASELLVNGTRLVAFWNWADRIPDSQALASEVGWVAVSADAPNGKHLRKLDTAIPVWSVDIWQKNMAEYAKLLDDSVGAGTFLRVYRAYQCLQDLEHKYAQLPRVAETPEKEQAKPASQVRGEADMRIAVWAEIVRLRQELVAFHSAKEKPASTDLYDLAMSLHPMAVHEWNQQALPPLLRNAREGIAVPPAAHPAQASP